MSESQGATIGKEIAWSKRFRMIFVAGAIPSTTLAGIGDFFSPKGGWMLPMGLGVIAAIAVLGLLVLGTRKAHVVTRGDDEAEGWWDGPRWKQLGVWVIASFALCAITFGVGSKNRAGEGGLLGTHISAVAQAQQQMGMLRHIVDNTGRAADATEAVRDTVKRETSENPQKELANRGIAMTSDALADAAIRRDDEVVALLAATNVKLDDRGLHTLLSKRRDKEAVAMLGRHGVLADPPACVDAYNWQDTVPIVNMRKQAGTMNYLYFDDGSESGRTLTIEPDRAKLWATVCSSPATKALVEDRQAKLAGADYRTEANFLGKVLDYL